MNNDIQDYTLSLWGRGRKLSRHSSGWISGNAPCCIHNGETVDVRGRGGIKPDTDGSIGYHCFNCNYKAKFVPGQVISKNFKDLLKWMGASDGDIQRLLIESLRLKEQLDFIPKHVRPKPKTNFEKIDLPMGSRLLVDVIHDYDDPDDLPRNFVDVASYAIDRFGSIDEYELYWTDIKPPDMPFVGMPRRLIIPMKWKNKIIGYAARTVDSNIPKYLTEVDTGGYIFNTENLNKKSDFVLGVEGIIDALLIDGVGILTNEISDVRAQNLESLGKKIIIVPDQDHAGMKMIDQALYYGWAVSIPNWEMDVKDVGNAVTKYGKLFTLKSILENVYESALKIELARKQLIHDKRL